MTNYVHPICRQIRSLRQASGLSLADAAAVVGLPDIVLGSYERGDRQPPLQKAEQILNGFGYTLAAVPKDFDAVRLPSDIASELRAIADQLEKEKGQKVVAPHPHDSHDIRSWGTTKRVAISCDCLNP